MEYGLIVTVLCLVIVFAVLALLIFILYGMRLLNRKGDGSYSSNASEEGAIAEIAEDSPGEDDNMIAAAIAAALNVYCEAGQSNKKASFIVRSIKRI